MTSIDLKSITIENFRSIKGRITVPLDAPIVLVHGVNGAGKSSLLSALELGLTGEAAGLDRGDGGHMRHLVHRGETGATIALNYVQGGDSLKAEVSVTANGLVSGTPVLQLDEQRTFVERCYLAQSRVSRLLEIYQYKAGDDSPLTRFIKELLGLDRLEALIDGLFDAGDIRRLRNLIPELRTLENRRSELEKAQHAAETQTLAATKALRGTQLDLECALAELIPELFGINRERSLQELLTTPLPPGPSAEELNALSAKLQDISGIRVRADSIPSADRMLDSEIESRLAVASAAVDDWRRTTGLAISSLMDTLRLHFPDLPAVDAGPARMLEVAAQAVERETTRLARVLDADQVAEERAAAIGQELPKAHERIARLQQEMLGDPEILRGLSRVLSELLPHIEGQTCPVCEREYSEVGGMSLRDHVATKISAAGAEANRLAQLGDSLREARVDEQRLATEAENLASRRVSPDERLETQRMLAHFQEAAQAIASLASQSTHAEELLEAQRSARSALIARRNLVSRASEIRHAANAMALTIDGDSPSGESLDNLLSRLTDGVESQINTLTSVRDARRRVAQLRHEMAEQIETVEVCSLQELAVAAQAENVNQALSQFNERRDLARGLASQAELARTEVVRKVFNHALNQVWRDLFVRLVPSEPFVPAFRVKTGTSGRVSAELETRHRDGGVAGNPTYMLSSGNLNTGAVTLFMALNFSADPDLPWLILDDPVQSMDEVHIAQLAALLRTLAKNAGKQLILAVHERSLFDYLSLELSPAFPGDKLITIELSRSDGGDTEVVPTFMQYEDDIVLEAG